MSAPTLLTPVICGPTAGGKSDLALALAAFLHERHHITSEIVTADAFQIYRGMDIGTAKPSPADRARIPHHLIDLVDPHVRHSAIGNRHSTEPAAPPNSECRLPNPASAFSAHDWLTLATRTIADIHARHALPIVVGGTHLYIKALLDGLFEGPDPDPALRAELSAMDPASRRAELERVDPHAAARIHPNDSRRTIRALEVFRLTGKPISAHQTQWDSPNAESRMPNAAFLPILLDWDVEPLNRRINARVKHMVESGLLEEVRDLLSRAPIAPQPAEALGYKQILPLVEAALNDGRWPPPAHPTEAAIEQVKIETRRFAKNQRTWLRRLRTTPGAIVIPMPSTSPEEAAKACLSRLMQAASAGRPSA